MERFSEESFFMGSVETMETVTIFMHPNEVRNSIKITRKIVTRAFYRNLVTNIDKGFTLLLLIILLLLYWQSEIQFWYCDIHSVGRWCHCGLYPETFLSTSLFCYIFGIIDLVCLYGLFERMSFTLCCFW